MDAAQPARKTRAIMFSDIQGYSKLMGDNEPLALRLLEEHNRICVPLIERHGGSVLKFIGDAILSAFESAGDAVQAGLELQRLLGERNASRPDIVPLVIRIGIHIGDVVFKDGDVFGDGVNIAARIEPLAEPGGIAISQTVYDMIKARPEIQTVSLGPKELKNIKEAVNIYKVLVWASEEPPGADWALLAKGVLLLAVLGAGTLGFVRYRLSRSTAAAAAPAALPSQTPAAAAASDEASLRALKQERTDAFWKMHPQLVSKSVPDATKALLAQSYYDRYHLKPGVNPGNAEELARYLPPGAAKAEMAALGATPQATEDIARGALKFASASRVADALGVPTGPARRDFIKACPVSARSWFLDIKDGEPARDEQGRLSFVYVAPSGEKRMVPVSASVLRKDAVGKAAIAAAAADIAADFLAHR